MPLSHVAAAAMIRIMQFTAIAHMTTREAGTKVDAHRKQGCYSQMRIAIHIDSCVLQCAF